ncbi:MAG TPA: hypothetical protein VMY77_15665 [Chitinophagaceae bacterium]|nr:hypothetical protein [Chitinophagaceae bacterium]
MKLKFFSIPVLLLTFLIFSHQTFAQSDSGGLDTGGGGTGTVGGSTGGTTPPPPAPLIYTFKRNNGNGLGVCGGDAQIRVAFQTMPDANHIPCINEVWYDDGKVGYVKITTIQYPILGAIVDQTQPYVSYCITGSMPAPGNSQGNINPAIKVKLVFGTYTAPTVAGTDNGIDITN